MSTLRRTMAAMAILAVALMSPGIATANPTSDNVKVRGTSCVNAGGVYRVYHESIYVDGIGNSFWFDTYNVPPWPGSKYVFMIISCNDGSTHDHSLYVTRPWGLDNWYDIGQV